jgi:hypothetical protein
VTGILLWGLGGRIKRGENLFGQLDSLEKACSCRGQSTHEIASSMWEIPEDLEIGERAKGKASSHQRCRILRFTLPNTVVGVIRWPVLLRLFKRSKYEEVTVSRGFCPFPWLIGHLPGRGEKSIGGNQRVSFLIYDLVIRHSILLRLCGVV